MSGAPPETLRATRSIEAVLANGTRVVSVPQPHLQGASLSVFVKVGPRYEQPETNGISHFLEHMLFRGTPRYATAYELSLAAEALGGTIDAATYADFTHYQLHVPSERALEALDLLAELLRAPRLLDLELEKKIVREEILADRDVDGREVDAENLSRLLLFPNHSIGFKITGEPENVERFDIPDLRRHLEKHYGAANMAVVATGDIAPEAVLERARQAFENFPRGTLTLIEQPPPPRHEQHLLFVKNEASQTDVRVCFRAVGPDDPDYMPLKLLLRVLDDGMSTRLHRRLTDESGLAYDAFASLDPYEELSVVDVGASVEHDKVPEVISVILDMLHEFTLELVSEAELEKARARYNWNLRRIIDSPEDLALYAGTQAIFGRRIDLASLWHEVEQVSVEHLRNAARRVFRKENLHIVCVGKVKKPVQKATERVLTRYLEQR